MKKTSKLSTRLRQTSLLFLVALLFSCHSDDDVQRRSIAGIWQVYYATMDGGDASEWHGTTISILETGDAGSFVVTNAPDSTGEGCSRVNASSVWPESSDWSLAASSSLDSAVIDLRRSDNEVLTIYWIGTDSLEIGFFHLWPEECDPLPLLYLCCHWDFRVARQKD